MEQTYLSVAFRYAGWSVRRVAFTR
jgi:hypothetical protein